MKRDEPSMKVQFFKGFSFWERILKIYMNNDFESKKKFTAEILASFMSVLNKP